VPLRPTPALNLRAALCTRPLACPYSMHGAAHLHTFQLNAHTILKAFFIENMRPHTWHRTACLKARGPRDAPNLCTGERAKLVQFFLLILFETILHVFARVTVGLTNQTVCFRPIGKAHAPC
jgi:hypothetical protein